MPSPKRYNLQTRRKILPGVQPGVARSEHEEQCELVRWFRSTYLNVRICAIPNGGVRGKIAGGRLKNEGVSAGVPDLFIPAWSLWIEMKRADGGTPSPVQKDWISYLQTIRNTVIVGQGFENAREKICAFVQNNALHLSSTALD